MGNRIMGWFGNIFKKKSKKHIVQKTIDINYSSSISVITPNEKLSEDYINAVFLNWAQYGYEIFSNNDKYPRWTSYKLYLTDPKNKHKQLVQDGYLTIAPINIALEKLRVAELKSILNQYNLLAKGKKDELINRIINNVDASSLNLPKHYVLSDKGSKYLDEHEDLVAVCWNRYNISFTEYEETRLTMPKAKLNDIFWHIFQVRYDTYFINQEWGSLRCNELHRALLLKSENNNKEALYYYILVTYYDLSGCGNGNAIEEKEYVEAVPSILIEIHKLGEFYEERMIDRCYKNYLPHHYMNKEDFRMFIKEIIKEYQQ